MHAAALLSDGYIVVAGIEEGDSGESDFVAFKLNPSDGTMVWKWKVW